MKKALVLSLVVVFALGVGAFAAVGPGDLTGKWVTTFTINPGVVPPTIAITSDLSVTYTIGTWDFKAILGITGTGLDEVAFGALGTVGMFTITSTLAFDPVLVLFDKWTVGGSLQLVGIVFTGTFTLYPNDAQLVLVADGTKIAGDAKIKVTATFGNVTYVKAKPTAVPPVVGVAGNGCDLDFSSVKLNLYYPFCCAAITSEVYFTCAGFQYVTFGATKIALPGIPWLTLDATLKFETQTKTLTITPKVDFGAVLCWNFYFADVAGGSIDGAGDNPISIGAFSIVGLGIGCEIGGVVFEGLSYWGTGTNKPTWLKTYWEGYRLSTTDDGCCGPFDFSLAVFFDPTSTDLFELAEIDAKFDIDISKLFNFGMTLDLNLIKDTIAWGLVFTVTW